MIVVALRDAAPDDPVPDERRVLRMRWVKTPHGLRARWELGADNDDFWVPGQSPRTNASNAVLFWRKNAPTIASRAETVIGGAAPPPLA
jgi:hypothetical protein